MERLQRRLHEALAGAGQFQPARFADMPVEEEGRQAEAVGKGRANNVLRHLYGMPSKEEQEVREAKERGEDASQAQRALDRTVMPVLPGHVSMADLQRRISSESTVIITCGNPLSMSDIQYVAETNHVRFEKEDW